MSGIEGNALLVFGREEASIPEIDAADAPIGTRVVPAGDGRSGLLGGTLPAGKRMAQMSRDLLGSHPFSEADELVSGQEAASNCLLELRSHVGVIRIVAQDTLEESRGIVILGAGEKLTGILQFRRLVDLASPGVIGITAAEITKHVDVFLAGRDGG